MDLSMEIDEEDDCKEVKKSKTTKKNRNKIDDGFVVTSSKKRNFKGIMLSVTKPSYTLKRGIGREMRSLRWEHRNRLRYLLRQLVRRQNWDEASGVLSVLLMATHRENNLSTNRAKYWATLKLLQHMGAAKVKPRKILHVYEIWMKKNLAFTKNRRSLKGRFEVQLEFLLVCLAQGDTDGAYHAVISLLQESGFASDPIANLVAGLAFSHLWYNAIQKEMQLYDSLEPCTPSQSRTSGSQQSMTIDNSNRLAAVDIQDSDSPFQQDSDTSIRIDKAIDTKEVFNQKREVPMEVDYIKKEVLDYEEPQMNSLVSDQSGKSSCFLHTGNKRYGSIFYARDIDYFLMPKRFLRTNKFEDFIALQRKIIHNDNYKAAVKHLKAALHSTPPAFEALLPLIQMLLLGDQVKEAVEEVENIVQISDAVLPFRLKASLLEHFSQEDAIKLCTCFEDTLQKDPTCSHSLAKLINLHHDGHYSIEKLLEMIALHLDATFADFHIWKEFASCFIRLSQSEEDTMSSCVHSYGDMKKESSRIGLSNIPNMLKDNVSGKTWRLRCRWWLTRHFTRTILASEFSSGKMELLTHKAATACHLYGPESAYVVNARAYLEKEKNREMLLILKTHINNAIGLYKR